MVPGASEPPETLELDDPATRERLLELYRPPVVPWLRLNFVTSVTGSAAGSDGTSETLTSAADRLILGVIRELADVVVVGAASVRAEGYHLPKHSPLAVVTTSGDLGGLSPEAASRVIVVCPASVADRARASGATVLVVPEKQTVPDPTAIPRRQGALSSADIVTALRGAGYASIVCEGGPALARQLVVDGVVDELCLTTSPRITPTTLPLFGSDAFAERPVSLSGLLVDDDGALYARWVIGAPRATG